MVTPYLAQQTVTDFSSRFADLKYSATLAITTDTTFTIPGKAQRYKALIKCMPAGQVWVADNATAAAPAGGGAFAATTSELLTEDYALCREVVAGDVLHFFSSTATTNVSISLFSVGSNN
jgi:hypothetical protein